MKYNKTDQTAVVNTFNQHNFSGTDTAVLNYAELYCLCTLYEKYGPLCARLNLCLIQQGSSSFTFRAPS